MKARRAQAFSLIEVVVATGIFAVAIVAVIGLTGPLSKRVDAVIDAEIASRVCAAIQAELSRSAIDAVAGQTSIDEDTGEEQTLSLVVSADGRYGRLWREGGGSPADNALNHPSIPGIAERDRYFLVTIGRARGLTYQQDMSGSLAIYAHVVWPYRVPAGPATPENTIATGAGADPSIEVPSNERRRIMYFFALNR